MDLNQYQNFVTDKTSTTSKELDTYITRLKELQESMPQVNVPLMITASEGLAAEGGEFIEIVKKMQWQGKELNEDNRFHMKRELGDALFYLTMGCTALGYTLEEVLIENVGKLDKRYVDGFTVDESENRKSGDL